jgi:hypothetical protein
MKLESLQKNTSGSDWIMNYRFLEIVLAQITVTVKNRKENKNDRN